MPQAHHRMDCLMGDSWCTSCHWLAIRCSKWTSLHWMLYGGMPGANFSINSLTFCGMHEVDHAINWHNFGWPIQNACGTKKLSLINNGFSFGTSWHCSHFGGYLCCVSRPLDKTTSWLLGTLNILINTDYGPHLHVGGSSSMSQQVTE